MVERINVRVKPNAKKSEILEEGDTLKIAVKAPAQDNKANLELIKFLSRKTGKKVRLVSGATSKNKVVELQ